MPAADVVADRPVAGGSVGFDPSAPHTVLLPVTLETVALADPLDDDGFMIREMPVVEQAAGDEVQWQIDFSQYGEALAGRLLNDQRGITVTSRAGGGTLLVGGVVVAETKAQLTISGGAAGDEYLIEVKVVFGGSEGFQDNVRVGQFILKIV